MENQYGIATKNRFLSMVDIDDDPIEFLKQQEAVNKTKKEKAPKSKQPGKKAAVQPETKVKEQNVQKKEEKERVNSARPNERGRGGRREPREIRDNDNDRRPPRRQGPREYRDNRGGDENVPPEFSRERPEGSSGGFGREGFERGRGRGRGRGGFRGGRGRGGFRNEGDRGEGRGERQGFGGPPGERKRDFDRHSGSDKTGIKAVEKKEGGGARNWGSYRDDMAEPQENEERAPAEETTENFELNESGEADPNVEVEDQPKQMTLDEWKALQKTERTKPMYKLRKAGEGEEGSQWSKGTAYTKKRVNSEGEEDEEEEDDEDEDEKRHGNKNLLDIKITFNDPVRRGRGGRRPRDGRGRGSRGSGRGERKPRDSAPRMDDETDFPRLVKTAA